MQASARLYFRGLLSSGKVGCNNKGSTFSIPVCLFNYRSSESVTMLVRLQTGMYVVGLRSSECRKLLVTSVSRSQGADFVLFSIPHTCFTDIPEASFDPFASNESSQMRHRYTPFDRYRVYRVPLDRLRCETVHCSFTMFGGIGKKLYRMSLFVMPCLGRRSIRHYNPFGS